MSRSIVSGDADHTGTHPDTHCATVLRHMHTCVHADMLTRALEHSSHMHVHSYMHKHARVCMQTCSHICTQTHIHLHSRVQRCTCMCIQAHTHSHVFIHVCRRAFALSSALIPTHSLNMCAHTNTCMHTYRRTHMYTLTHKGVR